MDRVCSAPTWIDDGRRFVAVSLCRIAVSGPLGHGHARENPTGELKPRSPEFESHRMVSRFPQERGFGSGESPECPGESAFWWVSDIEVEPLERVHDDLQIRCRARTLMTASSTVSRSDGREFIGDFSQTGVRGAAVVIGRVTSRWLCGSGAFLPTPVS